VKFGVSDQTEGIYSTNDVLGHESKNNKIVVAPKKHKKEFSSDSSPRVSVFHHENAVSLLLVGLFALAMRYRALSLLMIVGFLCLTSLVVVTDSKDKKSEDIIYITVVIPTGMQQLDIFARDGRVTVSSSKVLSVSKLNIDMCSSSSTSIEMRKVRLEGAINLCASKVRLDKISIKKDLFVSAKKKAMVVFSEGFEGFYQVSSINTELKSDSGCSAGEVSFNSSATQDITQDINSSPTSSLLSGNCGSDFNSKSASIRVSSPNIVVDFGYRDHSKGGKKGGTKTSTIVTCENGVPVKKQVTHTTSQIEDHWKLNGNQTTFTDINNWKELIHYGLSDTNTIALSANSPSQLQINIGTTWSAPDRWMIYNPPNETLFIVGGFEQKVCDIND